MKFRKYWSYQYCEGDHNHKTLPEAQRTKCIDSITHVFFVNKNQFKGGFTCISSNFGHQVALLALVVDLASSWCFLNYLQVWPPSGAIWWPNLQPMQVAPSGGQFGKWYKLRNLLVKSVTNASSATWWPKLELIKVTSYTSCSKLEPKYKLYHLQIDFCQKNYSSYRVNTMGPLSLWQCF